MKKQILLASFLLCSAVAFSSEQQEQSNNSNAEALSAFQRDNASLREELRYANSPAYFKNTVIFLVGAASGAVIATVGTSLFWGMVIGEIQKQNR